MALSTKPFGSCRYVRTRTSRIRSVLSSTPLLRTSTLLSPSWRAKSPQRHALAPCVEVTPWVDVSMLPTLCIDSSPAHFTGSPRVECSASVAVPLHSGSTYSLTPRCGLRTSPKVPGSVTRVCPGPVNKLRQTACAYSDHSSLLWPSLLLSNSRDPPLHLNDTIIPK